MTKEKAVFVQRRMRLARTITQFCQLQATYTPFATVLIEHDASLSSTPLLAEDIWLYLPSQLPANHRHSELMSCLIKVETKLHAGYQIMANNSIEADRIAL